MDINELESFKLSDAVTFHKELNPKLWEGNKLDPEVRDQLLLIAEDFVEYLGISNLKVRDVTISGSNAAYSYTPHSDLDLHVLVDFNELPNNEVYQELFTAKKTLYNDAHDITVRDVPVELYVQDTNQPHFSLGEYSVVYDKWIRIPKKRKANFDEAATKAKYEKLGDLVELALKSRDPKRVNDTLALIKRYRKSGLEKAGEFGPENLAFKAIRKQGLIQDLHDLKTQLHAEKLSIDEYANEDYDPNGPPPGPEFKPTMPAGTVRVDVSDVYDWYKLGQHISNLKGLGKHDFGKGPPSTILSFGDEDTEHKYIQDLEKTGLTTTDIDPVDPNQPKGMKRQKTDPAFNVNETDDRKAAVLKIQKHLNKKYGANLDLDGRLGPLTLKSINKFMPRAKTGLADEPNKTTAVQGKKLKETLSTLQHINQDGEGGSLEGYVVDTDQPQLFNYLESQGADPVLAKKIAKKFKRIGIIRNMYVDEEYRNQGLGTDLVSDAINDAFLEGAQAILLVSDEGESNEFNLTKWYQGFGFKKIGMAGTDPVMIMTNQINEASGYIPSAKEKNDPRFKTALTVDVKPDAIKKNAKAFNWKTSRAGIPPQARADGKIAEDLMREFKTFLGEQQEEMFPGYDKEHREKRLSNWLAKSWGVQNGKPQTFYHATTKDFDTFNTHGTGFASALGMAYEVERHGSFFAVDPKFAEGFIEDPNTGRVKEGGRILPVHLSIQSPIDLRDDALSRMLSDPETRAEFKENDIDLNSIYNHFYELDRWELFDGPEGAEFIDNLQKLGFDGAIINEAIPNNSNAKSGQVWVAFNPNQVKSVYNRGSFSPDDNRLTRESEEKFVHRPKIGYHVTATKNLPVIRKKGINADRRGNSYVWDSLEMAEWFTDFQNDEGQDRTILKIDMTGIDARPDPEAEDMSDWSSRFEPGTNGGAWIISGPIPPNKIIG
jgi:GNAT superfamily N-acetyltransferase